MDSLLDVYITTAKKFLFPIIIVLVSIFMVFQILIPNITSIPEKKDQITKEESKNKELRTTYDYLKNIDEPALDSQFDITLKALPNSKDVVSIFLTLLTVSAKTDVTLDDFTIRPGMVYGVEKVKSTTVGNPAITVALSATAKDNNDLTAFSDELYKAFPLAEISKLDIKSGGAEYDVKFFYDKRDTKSVQDQNLIKLSPGQEALLEQLKKIEEESSTQSAS